MKKLSYILLFFSLFPGLLNAQDKQLFKVTFSGFVKTDFIYDSRQTVNAREGHFLLYPSPEKLDLNGEDINAGSNFNILSIQSRLKVSVEGPEVLGAKTSSVVEGAFFGNSNSDINGFRLRHAFVKLDWKSNSVIAGQYWHPFFVEEVFPGVISFNTGVPFKPFSRNPQLRVSHMLDNVKISFTVASQRDFSGIGPNGTSSEYLRNSALPILNITAKYLSKKYVFGAGINYEKLKPELETTSGYKSDAAIGSTAFTGFGKYQGEKLSLKVESTYGENMYDLMMLGGYGVSGTDPVTNEKHYTAVKTFSIWTDIAYGKKIKPGLFVGYTENLGADTQITGDVYSRGSNIHDMFRISPRIEYNLSPLVLGLEVEYTSAAYGTPNSKLVVEDYESVSNTRILTAVYYYF